MSTEQTDLTFNESRALEEELCDPEDVIKDPHLAIDEKRRLLADWASDLRAVPDWPMLRRLDNGGVVSLSAILSALRKLDGSDDSQTVERLWHSARRHHEILTRWRKKSAWRRLKRDNDDEPPPVPVKARIERQNAAWA